MIQESCVNWGQFGCHYYNVRDYKWEDGSTIYLVKEKYTDEEHTLREFTDVYYYLCEEDYNRIIEIMPDFFSFSEKIIYKDGMDLDDNENFKSTSKRFIKLRDEKKIAENNLKAFRFRPKQLKEQLKTLESLTDEEFDRIAREFNDSPLRSGINAAPNITRKKRIELINLLLEKLG